jgi:hypothetical protein
MYTALISSSARILNKGFCAELSRRVVSIFEYFMRSVKAIAERELACGGYPSPQSLLFIRGFLKLSSPIESNAEQPCRGFDQSYQVSVRIS